MSRNTLRATLLRVSGLAPDSILPPMVPSIDCELSSITSTFGLIGGLRKRGTCASSSA